MRPRRYVINDNNVEFLPLFFNSDEWPLCQRRDIVKILNGTFVSLWLSLNVKEPSELTVNERTNQRVDFLPAFAYMCVCVYFIRTLWD